MRRHRVVTGLAAGLLIGMVGGGGVTARQLTSPAVRLEVARQLEKVGGDVRGAIREYEAVAIEAGGADPGVAAEAWLLLAGAYDSLGDRRARGIYERVVREFAGERDAAERARVWLQASSSSSAQGGVTRRRVFAGPGERVSPDGHYVAYSTDLGRKIAVEDLATGGLTTFDAGAFAATFSPDGASIAYSFCDGPREARTCEVRVADLTGTQAGPKTVFRSPVTEAFVGPVDWSPDGQHLAVYVQRRPDLTLQLGVLELSSGSLRVLKSTSWGGILDARFSPDGRDLAFNLRVEADVARHDIFLIAVDASREVPLVTGPADDFVIGWAPDGRHLLFGTNRNGSVGVWAQAIGDRRALGEAVVVEANLGADVSAAGMGADGTLFLSSRSSTRTIEIAPFDPEQGAATGGGERPIRSVADYYRTPEWSPDGQALAYGAYRDGEFILGIREMQTGREREFRLGVSLGLVNSRTSWAPDGSFVAYGRDLKGRYGVFRIDGSDGSVSPLVFRGPQGRAGQEGFFWSADGSRMYYRVATGGLGWICERDVVTGDERTFVDGQFRSMSVSPDGGWMALVRPLDPETFAQSGAGPSTLVVMPLHGGAALTLIADVNLPGTPEWAADSSAIYVTAISAKGATPEALRVPIDGGAVERLARSLPPGFEISPDGRTIAYEVGEATSEIVALDGVLSVLGGR